MIQQPSRIIRVPKDATDAPTARLGGNPVPSDAAACPSCGAYVADAGLHAAYHASTDQWRRRVNGVLNDAMRLLLAREGIPTAGESHTASGKPTGQAQAAIESENIQ